MGIKIKHTDPTLNEFATDDLIVNVQSGSLFFKSNTKLFKLQGDDQSTTDISDSLIITGLINSRGPKYTVELDGNHGSGPRINMGTSPFNTSVPNDSDLFMSFGAYGSINNLDTKDRDFHLYGTNTTTGFYFDESAGNFGIGTTAPTGKLTIYEATGTAPAASGVGTLVLSHGDSGGKSSITFRSQANSTSDFGFISYHDHEPLGNHTGVNENSLLEIGVQNDAAASNGDQIVFSTDGIRRLYIQGDGKIGIGTTSPTSKLHIVDTASEIALFKSTDPLSHIRVERSSNTTIDLIAGATDYGGGLISSDGLRFMVEGDPITSPTLRIEQNILYLNAADFNSGTSTGSRLLIGIDAGGGDTYSYIQAQDAGDDSNNNLSFQRYGGNVGIGTTAPAAKLHIEVDNDTDNSLVEILHLERHADDLSINTNAEGGYIGLYVDDDNFGGELARISWRADNANNYEGDGRIGFWTAKSTSGNQGGMALTEKMTLTRDGYVGIGTTSPSHLLEINTETNLGGTTGDDMNLLRLQCEVDHTHNLDFTAIRTETGTSWLNSGIRIQSKVDSTYQAFIQFNGNGVDHGLVFGAGSSTTSPESILPSMYVDSDNYWNCKTIMRMRSQTDGREGFYLSTSSQNGMPGQFETLDGTDLEATATATGGVFRNLIYFYDSPGSSDPGRIVHETSGVNVSGGTDFRNRSTIHLCPGDDNDYNDYVSVHGYDESEVIKFRTNGNIEYSGTITDTSDRRIKKNITPLSGSLSKILKLEGKSFNWKDERKGTEQIHGLIAQEVREVIPEIVREMSKYPDEKDPTLGITYIDLIPFLIESIKDQQKQIDELKRQINE